jgi:hypothetical protein
VISLYARPKVMRACSISSIRRDGVQPLRSATLADVSAGGSRGGTVEWSGENPGISLKEVPDGPFVVLASFFRVVLSPRGRGHAVVLLQSPNDASPRLEHKN